MLSLSYELSVPDFKDEEIGAQTLVRVHFATLGIHIFNDGQTPLRKIHVKPTVESYVGQNAPILFLSLEPVIVDEISPKSLVSVTFNIWPNYPGLLSVAVHITDSHDNPVMVKRREQKEYKETPVRWWFHVVENVSVEILRTLKILNTTIRKDKERRKHQSPRRQRNG